MVVFYKDSWKITLYSQKIKGFKVSCLGDIETSNVIRIGKTKTSRIVFTRIVDPEVCGFPCQSDISILYTEIIIMFILCPMKYVYKVSKPDKHSNLSTRIWILCLHIGNIN